MAKKKSAGKKKSAANNAAKAKPVEKLPADKSEATPETATVKAKSETGPDTAKAKGTGGVKNDVVKNDAKKQAKKPNKAVKYFRDLRSEFKKVVWPSWKSVVNNTSVVLAVMIGSALLMGGLDSGFAALLQGLLSVAGSNSLKESSGICQTRLNGTLFTLIPDMRIRSLKLSCRLWKTASFKGLLRR